VPRADTVSPDPSKVTSIPSRSLGLVRPGVWVALFLVLTAVLGLGRGLWTPDEPREAEIGREMYLHPGFVPELNGRAFIEKPPLYYWLVASSYAIAGKPSAIAARAVSGISGLLTLLVVYLWAARIAGRPLALVAVFTLGSSVQFLMATHWVLLDPPLMLFGALAAWAAWEILESEGSSRFLVPFYSALVLALWTKGLVGPALVGAGVAGSVLVARREPRALLRFRPWTGALVALLAVAGLVAALWVEGGAATVREWFWTNHVQRFVHPVSTGHERGPLYYLGAVPTVALPWLVPLFDLLTPTFWRRTAPHARTRRFCAAYFVAGVVLLSLAATKRENYLLPLLPPLFVLMAFALMDRWRAASRPAPSRWRRIGEWLQTALLVLVALLPGATPYLLHSAGSWRAPLLLLGALAVSIQLVRVVALRQGERAVVAGSLAIVLFATGALAVAAPALEPTKNFDPFVRELDRELPAGRPVHALGSDETLEGIVPFLTGRAVVPIDAVRFDPEKGPEFLVVQLKKAGARARLSAPYELLHEATLGDRRQLSLWRRPPAAADPQEP